MGLSLRNIGKDITSVLGRVGNTVNNDVIQPINRDVVQPVARVAPAFNPANNNSALSQAVGSIVGGVTAVPRAAADVAAGEFGNLTNNPTAELNAANAGERAQKQAVKFGQSIAQPVAEGIDSLQPRQNTYTPNGRLAVDIFGRQPIQNVEKNVATNFNNAKGNEAERLLSAGADVVGQGVKIGSTVIPAAKGVGEVADAVEAGLPAARDAITANASELARNQVGAVGKDVNLTPYERGMSPDPNETEAQLSARLANKAPAATPTPTPTPKELELGKSLGMNPEQVTKAKVEMANPTPKVGSPAIAAQLDSTEPVKLSAEERQGIIDQNSVQQTTNTITPKAQTPKAVVGETEGIANERLQRYNKAINTGSKLDSADQARLSDAVNDPKTNWASRTDNPALFKQTVTQLRDAHDYSLAADRAGGGLTLRFNKGNYSPLYFKGDDAVADSLKVPTEDRVIQNGQTVGFHYQGRKYLSYADAAKKSQGLLQPLNKNALEDARMYAQTGDQQIRTNLLRTGISRIAPKEISNDLNTAQIGNTKLVHAADGNLPFAVSERINNALRGYKSNKFDNAAAEIALKTATVPAQALRKVAFLGAPIHYANTARSFLYTTLPSLKGVTAVRGIGEAIGASLHPKIYQALEDAATKSGVRDFNRSIGIVERDTRPNLLEKGTSIRGKVEKFSPFSVTQRNMNRFINTFSWRLGEKVKELGVEPGTEQAQKIASEINNVTDRINSKMEGFNPKGERLFSSASLAPHWIRANFRLIKDVLPADITKNYDEDGNLIKGVKSVKLTSGAGGAKGAGFNNAGDIARTNVLGGRAVEAGIAVLASAIATGKMPTLTSTLQESGLYPNNPNPNINAGQTKPKSNGESQVMNLPTDPLGLAVSLFTDPQHFATARETPLLSDATQIATNTSWNGQPLVDKSQPGWKVKLAEQAGKNLLPFSVQNFTNPNIDTAQSLAQEVGLRTKTNPNDPQARNATAFFDAKSKYVSALSPNAQGVANQYFSREKNAQGQTIQNDPNSTRVSAASLYNNPNALAAIKKIETAGNGVHDPMWDLSPSQLKTFMNYQSMIKDSADQVNLRNNNQWIYALDNKRATFFANLTKSGNSVKSPFVKANPYPLTTSEGNLMSQAAAITDPTQKAQFYVAHPELTQIDQKYGSYVNAVRGNEGAAPLPAPPQPDKATEAIITTYNALPQHDGPKGGNATRAVWIQNNPAAYKQMTDYYTQASLYSVLKDASADELAGNAAGDQKFLKAAYSLGQYDITKNADGTYSIGSGTSGTSGSSGSSSSSSSSSSGGSSSGGYTQSKLENPFLHAIDIDTGGDHPLGKAKRVQGVKSTGPYKVKSMGYQPKNTVKAVAPTKAKVALTKSKV